VTLNHRVGGSSPSPPTYESKPETDHADSSLFRTIVLQVMGQDTLITQHDYP
jgi:hypothetical protein